MIRVGITIYIKHLIQLVAILVDKVRARTIPAPVDNRPCSMVKLHPSDNGVHGLDVVNIGGR
jgi:hypothetical protein